MTEHTWPTTPRPSRLSCHLQHKTLRFASPVSRATQVLRRDGARWIAEASFDHLNRIQAACTPPPANQARFAEVSSALDDIVAGGKPASLELKHRKFSQE